MHPSMLSSLRSTRWIICAASSAKLKKLKVCVRRCQKSGRPWRRSSLRWISKPKSGNARARPNSTVNSVKLWRTLKSLVVSCWRRLKIAPRARKSSVKPSDEPRNSNGKLNVRRKPHVRLPDLFKLQQLKVRKGAYLHNFAVCGWFGTEKSSAMPLRDTKSSLKKKAGGTPALPVKRFRSGSGIELGCARSVRLESSME